MTKVSTPTRPPHRRFEGLVLTSDGGRACARLHSALGRAGLAGWRVAPPGPGARGLAMAPGTVRKVIGAASAHMRRNVDV